MRFIYIYTLLFLAMIMESSAQYSLWDTIPIMEILVQDTKLAGGKVENIDPLILNSQANATLATVLSENTNIYIHSAAKGSIATASMRGAGASHTKVLWQDMPINSPMTGQVDFSLLPVYFTDEVVLHYGSASLVNTGGALGGSISLANTPQWQNGWHGKVIQGAGSFGTYSGYGQMGWSNSKITFTTRIFYEQSENNFTYTNDTDPEDRNKREAQDGAQFVRYGVLQEFVYRVSENALVDLNYWFQNSDRSIPRLMTNEAPEHEEKQQDINHRVQSSYKHYGSALNWELSTGFIASTLNYHLKNSLNGTSNLITNLNSGSQTYSSITQFKTSKSWDSHWKVDFNLSAAFHFAEFNDEKYLLEYDNRQTEDALFVGVHRTLGERFKISALFRQLLIDGNLIKPIPSLGVEWGVIEDKALDVKANVSRNYHNPTLNALYFMPGGNPNLKPEEGTTGELALNSIVGGSSYKFQNEVAVYYSVIKDWILWKPSQFGYWTPENTQQVHSRGFEYTGKITRNVAGVKSEITVKYAYTPTTNESLNLPEGDVSKGEQLIYLPKNTGSLMETASYKGYDFIWVSYYTGIRNAATASPLSGYWIANLSLGKEFDLNTTKFSIRFTVDNVFNTDYQSIEYRGMPGRNYFLMAKFEF